MAGKLVHFELAAKDGKAAKDFYAKLFGWTYKDASVAGVGDYFLIDGAEPGGALSGYTDKGPLVYFGTEDIEASIRKVRDLGGKAEDKQPIPGQGWWSGVTDPFGNSYGLFQDDHSVTMPEPQEASQTNR